MDQLMCQKRDKNSYIELCRFVGAIMIMLHHTAWLEAAFGLGGSQLAPGAWIFVEYFYILSGYFMTRHFYNIEPKCIERDAVEYVFLKIKRLLPYLWIGIFIDFIAQMGDGIITADNLSSVILGLPFNFLFLDLFPLSFMSLNTTKWFVSGLIIAMPIVIILLKTQRNLYKYVLCWIIPLFLYSVLIWKTGRIPAGISMAWFNNLLRPFAGVMLGSLCFFLCNVLCKKILSSTMRLLFSIVELISLTAAVILSIKMPCIECQGTMVFLFCVGFVIQFSGQEKLQTLTPSIFIKFGKLSMPLYCVHLPIFNLVRWIFSGSVGFVGKMIIGFALSFIVAIVLLHIVEQKKMPLSPIMT